MKGKRGKSFFRQLLLIRPVVWLGAAVLASSLLLTVNVYLAYSHSVYSSPTPSASIVQPQSPILWIYHKSDRLLGHVTTVFNRVGYSLGGPADDWDVLWSHEYPFKSLPLSMLQNLQAHQRVNHFPGSGCFTFKPQLATLEFSFIPKAFQLPKQAKELQTEAASRPEVLWVQKSNMHRNIRVKNIKQINVNSEGSFVQEFISNPLLIDGRKFDIGIYTAITSINPLRVYTYEEEVLIRFCNKDYHPFKANDPAKYVVSDDYIPTAEMPSLRELVTDHELSNKQALSTVLRGQGHDPSALWSQTKAAIRQVLLHCESAMASYTKKFTNSTQHFFEMVRFDFVVDEQLSVWLMEVNLSPNLASDHFPGNRLMYEQVLFSLLSLVGIARPTDGSTKYNGQYESVMLVSDHDIQVPLAECFSGECSDCSSRLICRLCKVCRGAEESFSLKMAFLEHVSRRNFRRVYPPPRSNEETAELWSRDEDMSSANYLMKMWFEEKCQSDTGWCS